MPVDDPGFVGVQRQAEVREDRVRCGQRRLGVGLGARERTPIMYFVKCKWTNSAIKFPTSVGNFSD